MWVTNDNTNTFIDDVLTRIETIRSNTGFKPNVMVIDHGTYNSLKKVDALLDRIRYTQRGILTAELLAAMFDLDQLLIGEAIYSTAKETKAGTDFTAKNVWEKNLAQRIEPRTTHEIWIRYSSLPTLTTTHRIVFGARIFEIKSAIIPDEIKEWWKIIADEQSGT